MHVTTALQHYKLNLRHTREFTEIEMLVDNNIIFYLTNNTLLILHLQLVVCSNIDINSHCSLQCHVYKLDNDLQKRLCCFMKDKCCLLTYLIKGFCICVDTSLSSISLLLFHGLIKIVAQIFILF